MTEIQFSRLKKDCPKYAEELIVDQELLLAFLNSPIRKKVMKFAKLNNKEINSITEIVDYYAKLKVEEIKKLKEKTQKNIFKIEVSLLKKLFIAEVIEFKKLKITESYEVAKKILQVEYPDSIILNMLESDKIATLLGIETEREFPSELIVFDVTNKKIIGVEVINK